MLYRVIISNYRSFADEVEFNMFPNLSLQGRDLENHVYNSSLVPVLKQAAIYGANGAGKSNFVHALRFMRFWVCKGSRIDRDYLSKWYSYNQYRLQKDVDKKPISFLAEFSKNRQAYIYLLQFDSNGVKKECLFLSGLGKNENVPVFERDSHSFSIAKGNIGTDVKGIITRQLINNPSLSLLGLICNGQYLDDIDFTNAYHWFSDSLTVIEEESKDIPTLIQLLYQNTELMKFTNKIFQSIDLGVSDMRIENEDFDDWLKDAASNEKMALTDLLNESGADLKHGGISKMGLAIPILDIKEENGKKVVRELIFSQVGRDGYVGDMDVTCQSTGTKRLLALVPALFKAIYSDSTVVIDEISSGIHPELIKRLIEAFGLNQTRGQLIYTTHDTYLQDQRNILRLDEIWLTAKKDGVSVMYSINEFKTPYSMSIEKAYREGRFGGIPHVKLS